jgi:tRNA(Arg) A34 adenosine deaminase TadA
MLLSAFRSVGLSVFLGAAAFASASVPKPAPDDPSCTAQDRLFMERAYALARYATTHGGAPFGALLVKDGKILAEYSNCEHATGDVTRHAETGLISAYSPKIDRKTFSESTLYTSSEPCAMCSGAIRFAGIGRVVFGTGEGAFEQVIGVPPNPHPIRCREILQRLSAPTQVLGPLMEAEGLQIHADYWPLHPIHVGS